MWNAKWKVAPRLAAAIAVVLAMDASGAVAAPCWEPPVRGAIVDPYREPACPWCPGNRGIEYATRPGSEVRAVAAGRVTFAGSVAGTNHVVVEHANGWRITYGDLRTVAVSSGSVVLARMAVGATGETFHLGLRDGTGYRDPAPYLGRWVYRPRLVPIDGSAGAPPGPPTLRCGTPAGAPNPAAAEESPRRNR